MARHMEQPASRHSKPAALKTSCRPSLSAWTFTCIEPGTTKALTERVHVAALGHRRGRAQVLDAAVGALADEGHVHLDRSRVWPGLSFMYL